MGSPRSSIAALMEKSTNNNAMVGCAPDEEDSNNIFLSILGEYKKCLDNKTVCTCTCPSHPYFCCCVDRIDFLNDIDDLTKPKCPGHDMTLVNT